MKMQKAQMFEILAFAGAGELAEVEAKIAQTHTVQIVRAPARTLVMLKFRESARNTVFYAAEALACECLVAVDGIRGYGAILGDDLGKVRSVATIDAAINAGSPCTAQIEDFLSAWKDRLDLRRLMDARLAETTKVDFSVME